MVPVPDQHGIHIARPDELAAAAVLLDKFNREFGDPTPGPSVLARRRGADTIDLGTDETDHVARHLYERLGFTNREGGDGGPLMYVYELEL